MITRFTRRAGMDVGGAYRMAVGDIDELLVVLHHRDEKQSHCSCASRAMAWSKGKAFSPRMTFGLSFRQGVVFSFNFVVLSVSKRCIILVILGK
jgi:hypothetical protein